MPRQLEARYTMLRPGRKDFELTAGTGIARLIKKLVFLNEWPRSNCRVGSRTCPFSATRGPLWFRLLHFRPLTHLSDARLFNSPQGISHTGIQFHQQRQKLVRQVPRRLVVGSQFLLERFWQVPRCLPAAGRMRLRRAMCWHGRKPYVGPVVSQSGNRHVVP
jgi:hypothetical protein